MLYLPEGPPYYRILALDPGTTTAGVAVLQIDLTTREVSLIYVNTLKANGRHLPQVTETFGERQAKQLSHSHAIQQLLDFYQPHCVISEAPYMGRFAQAFEALVEFLYMLRYTVAQYDPYLCIETIDPPSAKIAVGAPGRSKDKELVRQGVFNQSRLINQTGVPLLALDEHSIDAIAVGCYKVKNLSGDLL